MRKENIQSLVELKMALIQNLPIYELDKNKIIKAIDQVEKEYETHKHKSEEAMKKYRSTPEGLEKYRKSTRESQRRIRARKKLEKAKSDM